MSNYGKAFETVFKENWKKCFPNSFIFRLSDQVSGYKTTSQNPCDFICFNLGKLFLIECKVTKENCLNFAKMPQYERLLQYKNIDGVYPGILIWFESKDKIIWCPIKEVEKIKGNNFKSIKYDMAEKKLYNLVEIPSVKKRVFMTSDYSVLLNTEEGD